ncbi:MAG: ABC transporter permease [Candidatus Cryosericum sp.]
MNAFQYLGRNWPEVSAKIVQHLAMVGVAVAASLVVGLVLGIVVSRPRLQKLGRAIIGITGVAQAVPSVAVIALMFVYTGIGTRTAVIALSIYGVVPILFNVSSALLLVPSDMREAAGGMGMTPLQVLMRVELPLASQSIMAGLRTTVTIDVSTATVASVVGAGGIGDIIFVGLSVVRPDMIIAGTLLVASIAILSDGLLAFLQKSVVSRGLSASS